MLRLPEPMLARPGTIPTGAGWIYEPKLDGFRLLVCTHGGRFRARSRRGWNMSGLLPELAPTLPANVQLDGEIVALNAEGVPDFHRLSARLLHDHAAIAVTYFVFDVLAVEGRATTTQPYRERRALLEQLDLERPGLVQLVATFEDGATLYGVICERGLEGVVAKRLRDPVPARRARLGEDEEPADAAVRGGTRRRTTPQAQRSRVNAPAASATGSSADRPTRCDCRRPLTRCPAASTPGSLPPRREAPCCSTARTCGRSGRLSRGRR